MLGDTTFPKQVTLKVPDFKLYSHNMTSIVVADQEQHLSLTKMAQAARKDEQIFKTLTEPLLTGDIQLQSEWPDTNAILIFISLGIGIFLFFICAYLFLKVRKMATAMFILQQVSQAKSQEVPSFIYNAATTTARNDEARPNISDFISSEFSWMHASVILSVTVLIMLVTIVIFYYKNKAKNKTTMIALEITSGGSCVIVPIVPLSLCPSYWNITTPLIKKITISSFPFCKLFTVWKNFKVTNKLTSQSISVPTTIDIDFVTWRKLKTILSQPFCAYVLVVHHGFLSVLPNQQLNQNVPGEQHSLYPQL